MKIKKEDWAAIGGLSVLAFFATGIILLLMWTSGQLNADCRALYGSDYEYSERRGKATKGCYSEPNQQGERKPWREAHS